MDPHSSFPRIPEACKKGTPLWRPKSSFEPFETRDVPCNCADGGIWPRIRLMAEWACEIPELPSPEHLKSLQSQASRSVQDGISRVLASERPLLQPTLLDHVARDAYAGPRPEKCRQVIANVIAKIELLRRTFHDNRRGRGAEVDRPRSLGREIHVGKGKQGILNEHIVLEHKKSDLTAVDHP